MMTITERTLKKWRGEALEAEVEMKEMECPAAWASERRELSQRILRLTQVLLDQHLLEKVKKQ